MTSILVTHTGAIGDTIMILPLLDFLKNKKGYSVTVLSSNRSIKIIYQMYHCCDEIIDFPFKKTVQLFSIAGLKLIFKLRKRKFDFAFCPFPGRGVFAVLLMFLCGCKKRAHHRYDFKFFKNTELFLTDSCDIKREHVLKLNQELVQKAGFLKSYENIDFFFNSNKINLSSSLIDKANKNYLNTNSGSNFLSVGIYPGGGDNSAFEYKRWEASKWIKLINLLSQNNKKYRFYIFLGPGERNIWHMFDSISSENVKIVNNIDFESLIALISLMSIFIGNDGGLSHIASLFEPKQITIFTKTDFKYIHPINKNGKIITSKDYNPVYIPYKNLVKPVGDLAKSSPSVDEVHKACKELLF